ncbi:MAG: DUF1634 domain-containing protein [Candidatus Methanodesulfokora sp.]|nr:MAG: hypothetical protein C0200_02050 [Candidatus Korarchaeota archaeon]
MKVERVVYLTLTFGTISSLMLFSIGLVLDLIGMRISYAFILAATVVLVITPMIRVIAAIFAFASSKEKYNMVAAFIVLFFMLLSLIIGFLLRIMPSG